MTIYRAPDRADGQAFESEYSGLTYPYEVRAPAFNALASNTALFRTDDHTSPKASCQRLNFDSAVASSDHTHWESSTNQHLKHDLASFLHGGLPSAARRLPRLVFLHPHAQSSKTGRQQWPMNRLRFVGLMAAAPRNQWLGD